jgi:2-iminoacetate synthase ThiH
MALEEAFHTAASGYSEAITEFHIVGGLHPDLPFQYYLDLISGLKARFPQVHLKALTMVEIAFLAKRGKLSIEETLRQLKTSGLDSLPGGGAEIFNERVRRVICDHKIDGDQWLDTARTAHRIGLKSNATMLYGDIYSAGVSSGQHSIGASVRDHGNAGPEANCHWPHGTRQFSAHQGVLADALAQNRADITSLRRGRC